MAHFSHRLVVIGYLGTKNCYLDVDESTAIQMFAEDQNKGNPIGPYTFESVCRMIRENEFSIKTIEFNSGFKAYDVWDDSDVDREWGFIANHHELPKLRACLREIVGNPDFEVFTHSYRDNGIRRCFEIKIGDWEITFQKGRTVTWLASKYHLPARLLPETVARELRAWLILKLREIIFEGKGFATKALDVKEFIVTYRGSGDPLNHKEPWEV